MKWHAIAIAAFLLGVFNARADAKPAEHVAPAMFGRVFEQSRGALVQVRCAVSTWCTGFVIGAKGEVVFGAKDAPSDPLTMRTEDGSEHAGALLGWDADLHLAVGRMEGSAAAPLRAASNPGLVERRWVVVLKHDSKGRPSPFAGVVEADASIDLASTTASKMASKKNRQVAIAPIAAPASRGSPVLSAEGDLVGVALEEGARSTRAVAIETLAPFLKKVVLGQRD